MVNRLPTVPEAAWNSVANKASCCFPGTQEATLGDTKRWIDESDGPPIFWIWGPAGFGKSTLARTAAEAAHEEKQLGGSFFFSRDDVNRRNPDLVFPTLASQLATFNPEFKRRLAQAIDANPGILTANIKDQFQELIAAPLLECIKTERVVIVIDALDECDPPSRANDILRLWGATLPRFDGRVKILLTSRPELDLRLQFKTAKETGLSTFSILHDIEDNLLQKDIASFLRYRLHEVAVQSELDLPWPQEAEMMKLVELSGKLFVYAATVVAFLGSGDAALRLRILLEQRGGSSWHKGLDTLYLQVMKSALPTDDEGELELVQAVIWTIVLLREPLSLRSLQSLLQSASNIKQTVLKLHSVLLIPESPDTPIRAFHLSFREFLTSRIRCTDDRFFIDEAAGNARMASLCLTRMDSLTKDMCGIEDPWKMNVDVEDLQELLELHVPHELRYACLNFAFHVLESSRHDDALKAQLVRFCETKLLMWLEVMSLLKQVDVAVSSIQALRQFYKVSYGCRAWVYFLTYSALKEISQPSERVTNLLYNMWRLLLKFGTPIREGAGQIYVCALRLCPEDCAMRDQYHADIRGEDIVGSGNPHWDSCICTVGDANMRVVLCVAVAPNGECFAVGGGTDGSGMVMWCSTSTGREIMALAHPEIVWSVAISPTGSRLVAGDFKGALHIWDTATGISLGVLKGHARDRSITSVFFCPDDVTIISASSDRTLRLWDSNRLIQLSERTVHTNWIWSAALSRDGTRIATGSDDKTVCLWDLTSEQPLLRMEGHTEEVNCVAFLPGDRQLASGSDDRTIRIWNCDSEGAIRVLDTEDRVLCLAFASDIPFMAFSLDFEQGHTIHIWDTHEFTPIATLSGHSGRIQSLAFSPDGSTIASGSDDGTARLWTVQDLLHTTAKDPTPTESPSGDLPSSLSFSSDGLRVISASPHTSTIRTWTLTNNTLRPTLSISHPGVLFASFSSDGIRIVSTGQHDRINSLWVWEAEAESYKPLHVLRSDAESSNVELGVSAVSHTKNYIASTVLDAANNSSTIRLWDIVTLKQISKFCGHRARVLHMAFSSDDTRTVSLNLDEMILWDVESGSQLRSFTVKSYTSRALLGPLSSTSCSLRSFPCNGYIASALVVTLRGSLVTQTTLIAYDVDSAQPYLRSKRAIGGLHDQFQVDEASSALNVRVLVVRGEWLWERDRSTERRLSWIPPAWRGENGQMARHGRHLAIASAQGELHILDIDAFRERSKPSEISDDEKWTTEDEFSEEESDGDCENSEEGDAEEDSDHAEDSDGSWDLDVSTTMRRVRTI